MDFDFPALGRTRPVTDFTSNNNRPQQRRARDKPWDELALVRATDEQFKENEDLTPQVQSGKTPIIEPIRPPPERKESEISIASTRTAINFNPARNPITGSSFAPTAQRKESTVLLDLPAEAGKSHSTPRTGVAKTVTIHYTDVQAMSTQKVTITTTADTYIAELFDHACKKLNLEKATHVVKVHGTQTVAPTDRTVEALGDRLSLDLVRRRFIGAGAGGADGVIGFSSSPGSSSLMPLSTSAKLRPPTAHPHQPKSVAKASVSSVAVPKPLHPQQLCSSPTVLRGSLPLRQTHTRPSTWTWARGTMSSASNP